MNYALREVTESDYAWLWALKRETMRYYVEKTWGGWEEDAQENFFRQNFHPANLRVIVVAGVDAGLLEVERRATEIFLANIQLAPVFQNHGIGTAVVRTVMEEAHASGLPLHLQVLKANRPARRFYERLGFAVGEQSGTHCQLWAQVRTTANSLV